MTEKLKFIGEKLDKLAGKMLLILCICIFCILTYYSAKYTMVDSIADVRDNPGLNLLILTVITAVAVLLHSILHSNRLLFVRQRLVTWKPYIIGIVSFYVYIISLIWVLNSHVAPGGDGSPLCNVAHRMITGNFVDMNTAGYMTIFPHQFSLLSVIHLIFNLFGVWNYEVFQHLNALCMPLLFYSGYKFLQLVCEKSEVIIYYILFFLGCLPLFLYVPFVYGEIMSITFTMVLMWQILRYCRTGKKSCILWGTAAIVLACIVRKNSLIVLIAAGIVLVIHSIKKANLWGILWLLVMSLAVSGSDQLIHTHYEKISGFKVAGGVPYISWVRMGMQDSWTGPGWFDNSSIDTFREYNYNTEQTALVEKERLREILKDMWNDKSYSIDFFRRKILSQWNSPGYLYLDETGQFDCEPQELPDFVRRIYYDDVPAVQTYMNRYHFILYFYAAVSAIILFADRKKKHILAGHLLYISIIGGFLFSALWEASSRYILPYAVYMIPPASLGMHQLTTIVTAKIKKLSSKRKPQIPYKS